MIKTLENEDTCGSIIHYIHSNTISNVLKTSNSLCKYALKHYTFKFKTPDQLYYFKKKDLDMLLYNVYIDKTMIFLNASKRGLFDIVRILLKNNKVKHNLLNGYALIKSVEYGHYNIYKMLIRSKKIIVSETLKMKLIQWAFWKKRKKIINHMIYKLKIDINNDIYLLACEYGFYSIIELSFKKGINLSSDNSKGLIKAVYNNHYNIVLLLLKDKRTNPNHSNGEALKIASEKGYTDIVKLLLDNVKIIPDTSSSVALRMACKYGRLGVVKTLLKDGRSSNYSQSIRLALNNGYNLIVDEIKSIVRCN